MGIGGRGGYDHSKSVGSHGGTYQAYQSVFPNKKVLPIPTKIVSLSPLNQGFRNQFPEK